jgi:hypothetical protein
MADTPHDLEAIQAQRALEDRALALGFERRGLENGLLDNLLAVRELLHDAEGLGVPLDRIAKLVGVSRQTLYRWRDVP